MKRICLLLFACALALASVAQNNNLCVPTTFLKEINHPSQSTYISSQALCASGDGNLYMGVEWRAFGPNSLLIKMTPTGKVLWSRQLFWDEYSYFLTTITQIVLDSDGMLVISGFYQPGAANEFENFVCRYNPVQNVILWSKRISGEYFYAYKIVEKQAGANYLLYRTLTINGFQGQETEIMEINRQTGNTVVNSAKKIGWADGSNVTSILAYQGNLYAAGTQATGSYAGEYLLCKMNLNAAQISWANVGPGIAEKVTNAGLLIDQDQTTGHFWKWDDFSGLAC